MINYLISIAAISYGMVVVARRYDTQAGWTLLGLSKKSFLRLCYAGIIINVILIVFELSK